MWTEEDAKDVEPIRILLVKGNEGTGASAANEAFVAFAQGTSDNWVDAVFSPDGTKLAVYLPDGKEKFGRLQLWQSLAGSLIDKEYSDWALIWEKTKAPLWENGATPVGIRLIAAPKWLADSRSLVLASDRGIFLLSSEGSTTASSEGPGRVDLFPLEYNIIPDYAKITQESPPEQCEAFFPISGLVLGETEIASGLTRDTVVWSNADADASMGISAGASGLTRDTVVTVSPDGEVFALRHGGNVYVLHKSWDRPNKVEPESSSRSVMLAFFVRDTILAVITADTSESGKRGSLSAYHIDAEGGSITKQNNVPPSWASGVQWVAVPGTQWQYICTRNVVDGHHHITA